MSISYNRLANHIHRKMKYFGFYNIEKEEGTILMLMITEIVKLFDMNKVNRDEKVVDIAMRLYDYCGYKGIKINKIEYVEYDLYKMTECISNQFEGYRSNVDTNYFYIKECLNMCYSYAKDHNIDLEKQLFIKLVKLNKIKRMKKLKKI